MLLTNLVPIMAATVLVVGSTLAEAVHHCTTAVAVAQVAEQNCSQTPIEKA